MKKNFWAPHQTWGLLVAVFGATILYRWIFKNETITRLIPGSAEMELNGPLLLLAAGICCMFHPSHARHPAPLKAVLRLCVGLLMILPALLLTEQMFDVSLGVDFVREPVLPTESRPHPGRMSPNAALAFLCTGLAFFLIRRPGENRHREWLITVLVTAPILIGFAGLAGYFLRLETLYHLATFNQMKLPTAAGISLLGCGLWLLRQKILRHVRHTADEYRRRITRLAVAALTMVALSAGVAGFAVMRDAFEEALAENIMLMAATNATSLSTVLEDNLLLHRTIGSRPWLRQSFLQLQKHPQDQAVLKFLQENISSLMLSGLDSVRLYDANGKLLAATGEVMHDHQAPLVHRLIRAEQIASLVWQDGYMLHTINQVVVAGRTIGTVIAHQRLPAFDKLLSDLQASGPSTDALLCSRSEGNAVCAPSRFNPDVTTIQLAGSRPGLEIPINLALLDQSGVMATLDQHKRPVIAAYAPLQELGLGMVITVTTDTLYAPLKNQMKLLAMALAVLVALGTVILRLAVRPPLKELADGEKRMRAITDNMPVLISYIDREYKYRFCNKTFEDWLGIPAAAALDTPVASTLGQTLFAERQRHMERALAGERVEFDLTSVGGGVERHLHNTYVPDFASDGTVDGIYTLSIDVTPLKKVERQLQDMARFDALTGLPNRYQMNEKLVEAVARCRRSGAPMAVMFLDIDYFKTINDSLGHAAGDEVLKEFGQRLKASVRETDTVCRLGGDEFLIILEQLSSAEETEGIARKILANVGAPCEIHGQPLRIGTSIGIAYCSGQPLLPEALIDLADQALYQCKQTGRGTSRLVSC